MLAVGLLTRISIQQLIPPTRSGNANCAEDQSATPSNEQRAFSVPVYARQHAGRYSQALERKTYEKLSGCWRASSIHHLRLGSIRRRVSSFMMK